MGEGFLHFYREKVKDSWKTAFVSAYLIGLIVHMFRFTNVLPNHDAVYNYCNSQNMVTSGRWFLSIACAPSSYFDLPWMIGVLSLLYISLTAVVITEIFEMKNPVLIALCSGLLVSFPAITETMSFEFTADGYMLAMLLASVSVLLTKIEFTTKFKGNYIYIISFASLCICLACAIYQVYISFAYVLAVCYFMAELLENRYSIREYIKWIITQIAVYLLAISVYYLIWQLMLKLQKAEVTTYLGINNVQQINFAGIVGGAKKCVYSFVKFFVEWNVFELGLTPYTALNLLFIISALIVGVVAVLRSGCIKRKFSLTLIILCILSVPFISFVFCFNSKWIEYSARMLPSICILYIFVAVLHERWIKNSYKNIALIVMMAVVFNNSVTANMYYNFMNQCYEKSYATAVEMVTRIHLEDTGKEKYIAMIGTLSGFDELDKSNAETLKYLGALKDTKKLIATSYKHAPLFMLNYTDFELAYYRINGIEVPIAQKSKIAPAPYNWQYRFPIVDEAEMERIQELDEVKAMPLWPARDSIKVIDDIIIIKLSEPLPW